MRDFKEALRDRAAALGFQVCRVARPEISERTRRHFAASLARGEFAGMDWLGNTLEVRARPEALWERVRSVVVLGLLYKPAAEVLHKATDPSLGRVSAHALSRDYHEVLKGRAKTLGQWMVSRGGGEVRVYVDSAPVMEKPLAVSAGAGWQGRNGLLITEDYGPWLFLAEVFTSLEMEPDEPVKNRCGHCSSCMDACPTGALRGGGVLDARRCLAYHTTEEKGPVDPAWRTAMGNRIFGCDECVMACPWGRRAPEGTDPALAPRDERLALPLERLIRLDEAGYRSLFAGSGVRRLGFGRFRRNVLIAAGNSGDPSLIPLVEPLAHDDNETVAEAARWALGCLRGRGTEDTPGS
ncbi:tRNA epoxyqueuosine(34) reductase QueG [Phaeovibrio sulfidiphilus]|uniref:tRNA epoxyqueuosine(34) reductase QueG n=1 Tax=Phaeovibrio sulfidiphilus TaxID=1220600 RepID=A0A8J6YN42_9PROT|nr:tRNA epoxyqueuosine(34) reductase QueG [Phaeovibrio sulfidiphilus]MBE1237535.1 tRNA epoxyqueuosine(34) reductase QueG [Phaeovibrio sulfidiphilus]